MLLQTKQLEFQYPNGPRFAFSDLSLNPLSQLAIVGQSGSGKSTLLGILAGLNAPQQGEVLIENKSLYQLAAHEIDAIRGQKMGIIFQNHYVLLKQL